MTTIKQALHRTSSSIYGCWSVTVIWMCHFQDGSSDCVLAFPPFVMLRPDELVLHLRLGG